MDLLTVLFDTLLVLAFVFVWKSYFFPSDRMRTSFYEAGAWCALVAICASGICGVLRFWSAADVRGDTDAIIFYLIACFLWIFLTQEGFAILGVSLRDDVVERKNRGAGFTVAGLTIGVSCCAAGSNVGNGPGPEVVLLCAVLSTGSLFVLWILLASLADAAEAITVERDQGAGLRAGGWLAGSGAVLGASVAGDWVSAESTLRDFVRFVWPVFVVSAFFIGFEKSMNRRALRKRQGTFVSGLVALALAVGGASWAVWVARH